MNSRFAPIVRGHSFCALTYATPSPRAVNVDVVSNERMAVLAMRLLHRSDMWKPAKEIRAPSYQLQMCRVDTPPMQAVLAPSTEAQRDRCCVASVVKVESLWDRADRKFVGNAVRKFGTDFARREHAISERVNVRRPQPTVIRAVLVHLRPESLLFRASYFAWPTTKEGAVANKAVVMARAVALTTSQKIWTSLQFAVRPTHGHLLYQTGGR